MKTKSRQPHPESAGTAPKIQSVQRLCGLRQKFLQVGKGEIEAQPALGRLEVGAYCAAPSRKRSKSALAVVFFMCHSREVAPIESLVSTRAYTEKIRNDKS